MLNADGLVDFTKLGKKFVEPIALPTPSGEPVYIPLTGIAYIPQDILLAIAISTAQQLLPNIMENMERLLVERGVIPAGAEELPHHESQSPDASKN